MSDPITINYSIPVFIGDCIGCGRRSFICTIDSPEQWEVCYDCMAAEPNSNAPYAWIGTKRLTTRDNDGAEIHFHYRDGEWRRCDISSTDCPVG